MRTFLLCMLFAAPMASDSSVDQTVRGWLRNGESAVLQGCDSPGANWEDFATSPSQAGQL